MFTRNDTLFSYTTRFRAGARLRRPEVERRIHTRLGRLSTWLGEKDYLEGRFTVGDLMTAAVLRELRHTDFLAAHANLAAYQARCDARPAFRRPPDAQPAAFEKPPPAAASPPPPPTSLHPPPPPTPHPHTHPLHTPPTRWHPRVQ